MSCFVDVVLIILAGRAGPHSIGWHAEVQRKVAATEYPDTLFV
jgi:hypothetical protein